MVQKPYSNCKICYRAFARWPILALSTIFIGITSPSWAADTPPKQAEEDFNPETYVGDIVPLDWLTPEQKPEKSVPLCKTNQFPQTGESRIHGFLSDLP
jgi:hypothetical protein